MTFLYSLCLAGQRIASGEITGVDEGMGTIVGTFTPEAAYQEVRPLFEALSLQPTDADLCKQRDALRLALRAHDDSPMPSRWIHIFDFRAAHDDGDAAELNAALSQPADVQRILSALGSKP